MSALTDPNDSLVQSYLDLRKAVGVIGIFLPLVLVVGRMIFEAPGILDSISSYYYSVMGNVFVGSLCAIGVFLWSYRGYEKIDAIAGNLAAVFAIGVALFPTAPDAGATQMQMIIGTVHLIFAGLFFATLAFFALFLFRKTHPNVPPTPMKLVRNIVYTVCGCIIIACIVLIVFLLLTPANDALFVVHPVFWLESLADVAFGVSWFVKGEAILKD